MVDRLSRIARRARRVVGSTLARRAQGKTPSAPTTEPEPDEVVPVRHDPVPELVPPPDVLHVVVVEGVPVDYGGRTASILARCRSLAEAGGIESVILVRNHSPQLSRAVANMERRGHLLPGVRVVSVTDAFPDPTLEGPPDPRALEAPEDLGDRGWSTVGGGRDDRCRYEEGRLVARRRYSGGRLQHEDTLGPVGERLRRDEFAPDGRLVRTIFGDDVPGGRQQHVALRRDGRPMFARVFERPRVAKGRPTELGTTVFDEQGEPSSSHAGFDEVVHRALDAVIGGRRAVVVVEARALDREMAGYDRPGVATCYVVHSSHLAAPGDDLGAVRPNFRPVLTELGRRSPVVFLTERQRAEVEAALGENPQFRVIPHAGPESGQHPAVERDPDLVVMVGRLADVKRTSHGIKAFARVLKERPGARLEIYGEGPNRAGLAALVTRLGLQDSVQLKGFTTDPDAVFARASLCLLTSRYEGAPMVLVEAMTQGCPAVAYDIRYGPSDMIEEGVNGFVVPPGDVKALAAATLRVLQDDQLAARLREGCAVVRQRFGQEAFVARWFDLFHEMSDGPSPTEEKTSDESA
ncbi:Glycosyl transferase, group 1 [Serinicoccus hydrothermalis]|uniref:Glycosyl transferase, group 1 n=1 Tax=Serinicoccus hydrothermalis TaxID=1758689 RepID=A0A1B1NB95_9MICO|nr:glycosyltransferase [Serinicoccus hydrothermalis]ANS78708.1 Glycosyl transferase, group 1 [Serinicoccus hydrothermalis]